MKIGVVGLGLIGGSLAKGFNALNDVSVLGYDNDESTLLRARLEGVIKETLTKENIGQCSYVFISLYPKAAIEFLKDNAKYFKKNSVVVDCCGIKESVCRAGFSLSEENGFSFIGGHPMAGTQFSGFKYSRASIFDKASMILVPHKGEKIEVLQNLKELLVKIGFKSVTITTAKEHDRIIAYTSQLAHVVSNAYVKSPSAKVHKGFSAGSYRDLTRVAKLNAKMWTELFLENGENLSKEIDFITEQLRKYSDAIKKGDAQELEKLLEEGSIIKESIG